MNSVSVPAPSLFEAFGLNGEPFAPCESDSSFFPSDQHLRALELMGHTLWTRARLAVITAPQGCGKTLLISRFVRDLDDRVIVAAITRENINAGDFLLEILGQFGIALDPTDRTDRRRLAERFITHQASQGRLCVLIVENAQTLHPSVLEELRALARLESDGVRLLKVILLGQAALTHVLDSPRMAELKAAEAQRVALEPLSDDQTAAYVAHRLRAAGAQNPDTLMPYTLMPQVHACTGGVPLLINRLCSRALERAFAATNTFVTPAALDEAIDAARLRDRALPSFMQAERADASDRSRAVSKLDVTMQRNPDRDIELQGDRILIGRGDEADVRIE